MIAADLMTKDVITITEDDILKKAFVLCNENKIRQVPVVDSLGKVVSVITAKKILKSVLPNYITQGYLKDVKFAPDLPELVENIEKIFEKKIGDMIKEGSKQEEAETFTTVSPDTCTTELAALFVNKDIPISCIVVVDDGGRMLGVISPWDLFKRLWEHIENKG